MSTKSQLITFLFVFFIFTGSFFSRINAQNYNYMGGWDNLGVPDYLLPEGDSVSYSFLQAIWIALPEGKSVPIFNPHYIAAGFDMDVFVTDTTEIWISYAHDGAKFLNVMGYYTYDLNNPSRSIPDSNVIIFFPNHSQVNKGGGLLPGDKIYLGEFLPNTGIGWVMLADGFVGGNVTPGRWTLYSNPNWNPEPDTSIRKHTVILEDTINQLLLVGMEDIRRDSLTSPYGGCDNDFNDAVFYVTASNFSAIDSGKYNYFDGPPGGVTSGNNGGVESNGTLAHKIARRNFERMKNRSPINYDDRNSLPLLAEERIQKTLNRDPEMSDLIDFIPDSTVLSAQAYISTPYDLLNITNAVEVFSADYFTPENQRISAILATRTENKVYEHTKFICDRMTGAELMDIEHVMVMNHWFIVARMMQRDGTMEYVSGFTAYVGEGEYIIDNHWNVEDFENHPENFNFQFWAANKSIVRYLMTETLELLNNNGNVSYKNLTKPPIPQVFVRSGKYQGGELILDIQNNNHSGELELFGSYTASETMQRENTVYNVTLTGQPREKISLPTGGIFDIGLSVVNYGHTQTDVIYFSDGPWGLDYEEGGATVGYYEVFPEYPVMPVSATIFPLERSVRMEGMVKDYISVYKAVLPANELLDASGYNALEFEAFGSHQLVVTVVKNSIDNWTEQFRAIVNLTEEPTIYTLPFSSFISVTYPEFSADDIANVVFSVVGNGSHMEEYELGVGSVAFVYKGVFGVDELNPGNAVTAYPNPFTNHTMVQLNVETQTEAEITVFDMTGREVVSTNRMFREGQNSFILERGTLEKGMYLMQINGTGVKSTLKLMIR